MSAPEAPIEGTITSWQPDDSIGRITLATGEEVRFGHSACVGMRPAVGVKVWVVELAPHPLGGRRAKLVNATGTASSDRATDAPRLDEQRKTMRKTIEDGVAKLTAARDALLAK